MITLTDKLSLNEKGQEIWDSSAPQMQYIYNKVMDNGLEGSEILPNIMNEQNYEALNDFLTYHLHQEEIQFRQRQFEHVMSDIRKSRQRHNAAAKT